MDFYCSEKFRMNGNHTRIDVWLIYKCAKCDTTLKLTIKKGIKPHDIPRELFDGFTHNDAALAWRYAFDKGFLRQNECIADYSGVKYTVEGAEPFDRDIPLRILVQGAYVFDLKLIVLLANAFGLSVGKLKDIIEGGFIESNPPCDIIKHKIKSDIEIYIRPIP
jgi:hypothetical protein